MQVLEGIFTVFIGNLALLLFIHVIMFFFPDSCGAYVYGFVPNCCGLYAYVT